MSIKCYQCGAENPEIARFCKKCGLALQLEGVAEQSQNVPQISDVPPMMNSEAPQQIPVHYQEVDHTPNNVQQMWQQPKNDAQTGHIKIVKRRKFKPILLLLLALVVVIAAVGLFFLIPRSSETNSKTTPQYAWVFHYQKEDDETYMIVNTEALDDKLDGFVQQQYISRDGRNVIVLTSENILYHITPERTKEIDDDVNIDYGYSFYARFSDDGNTFVYVDKDDILTMYSCVDEKVEMTVNKVVPEIFAISPDGKNIAYTTYKKLNENDRYSEPPWNGMELFVWNNGKAESIGEDLACFAISNQAEHIYTVSWDEDVQVHYESLGKERIEILSETMEINVLAFNESQSELFIFMEDQFSVFVNGEEVAEIDLSMEIMDLILVSDNLYDVDHMNASLRFFQPSLLNQFYFLESYRSNSSELVFIDDTFEMKSISENLQAISTSNNGKTLFYINNKGLYKVEVENISKEERLIRDSDLKALEVTNNGKEIYYIDVDDTLWYLSEDNDQEEIMEDVKSIQMNEKDDTLFIQTYFDSSSYTSTLYTCVNGEKPKRIAKGIDSLQISMNAITYAVRSQEGDEDVCEYFASPGTADFESILEVRSKRIIETSAETVTETTIEYEYEYEEPEIESYEMDLSGQGMTTQKLQTMIASGELEESETVTHVDLSYNELEAVLICAVIKDIFPNVTHIDLSYNQISDIRINSGLEDLQELDLSGNLLWQEEIDTMKRDIPNCEIIFEELNDYSGMTSGQEKLNLMLAVGDIWDYSEPICLNLSSNQITKIDNFVDSGFLDYIVRLDLSYNQLEDVSSLKNLTNLQEVKLAGNPLSQNQIEDLKNLMPNCKIRFDNDLSRMNISTEKIILMIVAGDVVSNYNYKYIDLSYNKILHVERFLYGPSDSNLFDGLTHLDLSNNWISGDSFEWIDDSITTEKRFDWQEIDLSNNWIKDISSLGMHLAAQTNLKVLHLTGNSLTQAQIDELQDVLPNCRIVFNSI